MPRSKAFITRGTESAAFWQFNILWQIMATGTQTDGKLALIDEVMQLTGPSTHTHTQDEGLYVVKGRATFNAGGEHGIVAGPGTFIAIPKFTEHSFQVEEPNSRLLNFYLPAGFEMVMMGVGRTAEKREPPPPQRTREWLPDMSVAAKLNEEYGTTYKFVQGHSTNPEHYKTEPTPGATSFTFLANVSDAKENVHHGNALWGILASSQATGGTYSLFELRLRKGPLYGPRTFAERDTAVFVLAARMTFFLDEKWHDVENGGLVWIPQNTVHSIRTNNDVASCLYLQTPGGLEDLMRYVGTSTESAGPPHPSFVNKSVDPKGTDTLYSLLGIRDVDVLNY